MDTTKGIPTIIPDGSGMRLLGGLIKQMLPSDVGFCLLTFEFNKPGLSNYISTANREDVIICLREVIDRLENDKTIATPEQN